MNAAHRRARRLIGASAGLCLLAGLAAVDAPASADPAAVPAESWVTNGTVHAVRQVGNRIYVGGSFTQAGPNTGFGDSTCVRTACHAERSSSRSETSERGHGRRQRPSTSDSKESDRRHSPFAGSRKSKSSVLPRQEGTLSLAATRTAKPR